MHTNRNICSVAVRRVDVGAGGYGARMARTALPAPEPDNPGDIDELVAQHTELRPDGHGKLRGLCPFCRSTAFFVRPSHGTFYCLRCGVGGDARAFAAHL